MYITSLSVGGCEYHLTVSFWQQQIVLRETDIKRLTTSQLKSPNLDCLLCYNVYKQAFMFEKIKPFTFKHGLNRGIYLSLSEMNMRNSVLQMPVVSVLFGVC